MAAVSDPSNAEKSAKKDRQSKGDRGSSFDAKRFKTLVATYSEFPVNDGQISTTPGPALVEFLRPGAQRSDAWRIRALRDAESNVIHHVLLDQKAEPITLFTLGGSAAALKRWIRHGEQFEVSTLWKEDFGGRFSRMRDAAWVDDTFQSMVIGTHDQGVVALLDVNTQHVKRLYEEPNTFIHEVEIGDLDGDGKVEAYVTASEPNKLKHEVQRGKVLRIDFDGEVKVSVVVDFGDRHAKEILVGDVDGDGRDELYASVESTHASDATAARVDIVRVDAGAEPGAYETATVARLVDRQCRFLTAGDIDGDGKKELVAAAFRAGVWLLRPGKNPRDKWSMEIIDDQSSGFEHAALLADLDGDGLDELYVAADDQGELRRYVYLGGKLRRRVIATREHPRSRLTWNLAVAPPMSF